MTRHQLEYKKNIASKLDVSPTQIDLYWKGRVGLYALLKAFGVSEGGEVVMPAFTCVVVPNAVLYLGAKPVYVDVSTKTLNTELAAIKEKVTERTKCILIQNTFGLSSEVEEIVNYASDKGILTIEDCTHGFGGTFNGKMNGTYCDAAFYSTQWNKPFSTGVGGFSLLNNLAYQDSLKSVNEELEKPGPREKYMLSLLIKINKYLLNDFTYWTALKLYRKLSKKGLVVGSSKDIEIVSTEQPKSYFISSSSVQNKAGIRALKTFESVLETRARNGKILNDFFKQNGLWHYQDEDIVNHSFLKYPVFVKDKLSFQEKAEKARIKLGDWFVSPIHPVMNDFDQWKLKLSDFPLAESLSNKILNITTEDKDISRTIAFLEENKKEMISKEQVEKLSPHME